MAQKGFSLITIITAEEHTWIAHHREKIFGHLYIFFDAFSHWAGWMQTCLYSLQLKFLGKGEGVGEQTRYWINQSRASEYKRVYRTVLGDPNRIRSSSEAKMEGFRISQMHSKKN